MEPKNDLVNGVRILPIDVKATPESGLHDTQERIRNIQEYVKDVQGVSVQMKGVGLMSSNMYVYVSAQSAIDIAKDILDLIDGKKITTIAEMQIRLKKEQEELEKKLKGDAQEAYTG